LLLSLLILLALGWLLLWMLRGPHGGR